MIRLIIGLSIIFTVIGSNSDNDSPANLIFLIALGAAIAISGFKSR